MTEKRFVIKVPFVRSRQQVIIDNDTQKSAIVDCYNDNIDYFVDLLNALHEENEQLQKTVIKQHKQLKARGMTIMNLKSRIKELGELE